MAGLTLLGGSFAWIATAPLDEDYRIIVVQMILMGVGLGLTQAPATDSILSVLPPAKAGVGSAINDAARETGGTLGVAVVGSVYASIFAGHLDHSSLAHLPATALAQAQSSIGAALTVAHNAGGGALNQAVGDAFLSAFHVGCIVAAAICWAGALTAITLPGKRRPPVPDPNSAADARSTDARQPA
jgi:hypothetical protein